MKVWNCPAVGQVLLFFINLSELSVFAKLEDSELKAIYRYLKIIEPVNNPESGKTTAPEKEGAL